ncbi:hypothetical protein ISF_07039 [Cordyceps fumosorosea ARSEF 2679]|uniref:Uncharacterized protein n=1 Tax=Cordyceps fumosorosea (strain ARSEF 2679) TaxID=1081104 RepID=A0A167QNE3_CORFA|nr:hypothetical protein ISF_07039 [Cordyceps fumosorosea ARSEF 2679]OAA57798.1 hypothetical protein ISF_07039 [Cordyceps fumosorosea ARSEF 2679]
MKLTTLLPAVVLPAAALAAPASSATPMPGLKLSAVDIIKTIAPKSATCAAGDSECRTAEQAAPHLFDAMNAYGLCDYKQMAAVLALVAFESVQFRYKHNVYPGRAGQGTVNMQMPNYNLLYAQSLPGVRDKVAGIKSVDGASKDTLNEMLALLTVDGHNFASGAWFLATQCPQSVRDALAVNIDTGFTAYMGCVGVTIDEDRTKYLTRAKQAFELK